MQSFKRALDIEPTSTLARSNCCFLETSSRTTTGRPLPGSTAIRRNRRGASAAIHAMAGDAQPQAKAAHRIRIRGLRGSPGRVLLRVRVCSVGAASRAFARARWLRNRNAVGRLDRAHQVGVVRVALACRFGRSTRGAQDSRGRHRHSRRHVRSYGAEPSAGVCVETVAPSAFVARRLCDHGREGDRLFHRRPDHAAAL